MTADALPSVDGRRARRDQNRERVVDAILELYREGDLEPSLADVAERSGVSHRSVFRYFEDLDELYRVAIQRQWESIASHLRLSRIGQGSLEDRIAAIVEQRLDLYDVVEYVHRVGHMKSPVQPVLLDHRRSNIAATREQIERHFAAELGAMDADRREATAEAVTLVVSIETIETMQFLRGLSREQCRATMTALLTAVLGG